MSTLPAVATLIQRTHKRGLRKQSAPRMRDAASHASLPGIKVQIVDPPAWTPPYDHALSSALAKAGADVELVTTEFPLSSVPEHGEYRLSKRFYRQSARLYGTNGERRAQAALRRGIKLVEHVPELLLYRRHAADADVVHYQWLTFPALDVHLLPPARPRVFTATTCRRGSHAAATWRRSSACCGRWTRSSFTPPTEPAVCQKSWTPRPSGCM